MKEIAVLSKELLEKLESIPDNQKALYKRKLPEIDAALKAYYPRKSLNAISEVFGVSPKTIQIRAKKLGLI